MRKRKLLTLFAVMISIILAAGTVNAAEMAVDKTVTIMRTNTGLAYDISVYPGKEAYSGQDGQGNPVTGFFGKNVADYRFFTTVNPNNTGVVLVSYADGGSGIVDPVVSPAAGDLQVNENEQRWADVWTETDPVDFTSAADYTNYTLARCRIMTGTINISGLKSGSLYFIYGSYLQSITLDLTMSGPGQEDIAISHTQTPDGSVNMMWISKIDFAHAGEYDTITYDYTAATAGRGRFMGVIVDGLSINDPVIIYPQNNGVVPFGDVTFEWVNLDPNAAAGATETYVDVWLGTDPNKVDGDYTKIVDGQSVETVTVPDLPPNIYYWQIDSYAFGKPLSAGGTVDYSSGDPCMYESSVYMFTNDSPVESVDLGPDVITWLGEPVDLVANVTDDGGSPLTYSWSHSQLPEGVNAEFNPNEFDPAPQITVTKSPYFVPHAGNDSFENPVLSDGSGVNVNGTATDFSSGSLPPWKSAWAQTGTNNWAFHTARGGAYNPTDEEYAAIPDGENVGWVTASSNPDYEHCVYQKTGLTIEAGKTYVLTAMAGRRLTHAASNNHRIEIVGSGIAATSGSQPAPAPGEWVSVRATYTATASDPNVGEPLTIRLVSEGGSSSNGPDFDQVVLTVDDEAGTWEYDPSMISVTVTAEVHDQTNPIPASDSMVIYVYDNACVAARDGLGRADLYKPDIDGNCVTDFLDFASLAEKWLSSTALTAPVTK